MVNLKLLGQNTIIYAVGNMGTRGSSFLLIPLYTHFLSMSDFGLLATLLLTIQVLIAIICLGVRPAFIRFAAEYEIKKNLGSLLTSTILITVVSGTAVSTITILFLRPVFRSVLHVDHVIWYTFLTCCAAIAQSLFFNTISYYRARNEGIKYMIGCISAAIALLILTSYFLVLLDLGIKGVLLAQIVTYGGLSFFIALRILIRIGIRFSAETIKKLLIFGSPLVFAGIGDLVTATSALYLLSYFTNLEQVAIYSLGHKIASIAAIMVLFPFELAYEPFVFAHKDNPGIRETISKSLTYLMLLYTLIAGGIVFVSRFLLPIIAPPGYYSAYMVTFLLLPGIAFYGVISIGQSLLHIKNKSFITGTTILIVTLISIVLQYLLIPKYGLYAVVFVYNTNFISIAIVLMALGMKAFSISLEKKRLLLTCLIFISILSVGFFLWDKAGYIFYSVIPTTTVLSLGLLYVTGFFHNQEKAFIRTIYHGVIARG